MKTFSLRPILLGCMIVMAVGVSGYAFSYFSFNVQNLLLSKDKALLGNILYRTVFYVHAGFGAIALLIGGWQFVKSLRTKHIRLHRGVGKLYVLSVLLSSVAGFGIGFYATGGLVPKLGFVCLALLWCGTNLQAYQTIRRGNIDSHRQWMIRNYALTFAAVTLRVWLPLLQFGVGLPFLTAYPIVAWLCWVPNLLLAEWIVRSQSQETRLVVK